MYELQLYLHELVADPEVRPGVIELASVPGPVRGRKNPKNVQWGRPGSEAKIKLMFYACVYTCMHINCMKGK